MSGDRRSWKYFVVRSALALLAGLVVIIATRLVLAAYFPDISLIWALVLGAAVSAVIVPLPISRRVTRKPGPKESQYKL
jgi:hypothetical protein